MKSLLTSLRRSVAQPPRVKHADTEQKNARPSNRFPGLKIRTALGVVITLASLHSASPPTIAQGNKPTNRKALVTGVWMHPSFFGVEKDKAIAKMRSTFDDYTRAGINTLIILVKSTSGFVYFKSAIAPMDTAWHWDFFGTFLREAQKHKMAVHPWFCVFTEGAQTGQVKNHPEWLIRSVRQETTTVVNPVLPAVREYEISLMTELVRRYQVDWIHLDYIRFPCEPTEVFFSFDEATRTLFRGHAGQDPVEIRYKNSGSVMWSEWIEWNTGHVTKFVRELKQALKGAQRPINLSAAVFPDAEKAKVLIGQDWAEWVREGLIEMLCPMLYVNQHGVFEKYLRRAVDIGRYHALVCAGIGISAGHNQNTPPGVHQQIQIARDGKADGFVLFSSGSLTKEFLQELMRKE